MKARRGSGEVRFIRKKGRIIPIRARNDVAAARGIFAKKNHRELATIGGAAGVGLAGLYGSGRLQKKSDALMKAGKMKASNITNRFAKIGKFSSKAIPALIAGSALVAIDRRTKDEGTVFDIGNKTGAFNIATVLLGGYLLARTGKRFEKWGLRGGKFPKKLRDI